MWQPLVAVAHSHALDVPHADAAGGANGQSGVAIKRNMAFRFLIAVLATWRVTHLLAEEDGPWNLIVRIRELAGGGFWGELLDCFKCLSLWVAAPLSFFVGRTKSERMVIGLSLSGAAILIQEYFAKPYIIEEEQTDGLLRSETEGSTASSPQ